MKDQYFGDFGDYQKFSLLKSLRDIGKFAITVYWMRTHDDGSADGKHISYLEKPDVWARYDQDLFQFIEKQIDANNRKLRVYEKSEHARGMKFINAFITEEKTRSKALSEICSDAEREVIFIDPDNGIEVPSMSPKTLHKYALWSEMDDIVASGKTVLVYQHFPRRNRKEYVKERLQEMRERYGLSIALRVKHSVYFVIPHRKHQARIHRSVKKYITIWGPLAELVA